MYNLSFADDGFGNLIRVNAYQHHRNLCALIIGRVEFYN